MIDSKKKGVKMSIIVALLVIGFIAGSLSGFVGIGGGMVVVPALIFLLGLTQHQAQGTSLAMMLPPIGILAAVNYYKVGQLDSKLIYYAAILAVTFIIGGYFGSKLSLSLSPNVVRKSFGVIMIITAIKMIFFTK